MFFTDVKIRRYGMYWEFKIIDILDYNVIVYNDELQEELVISKGEYLELRGLKSKN